LIIIAEAIHDRVLMKHLMSYINNHSLIKIISQEHYIEKNDLITILWIVVEDVISTQSLRIDWSSRKGHPLLEKKGK